MKPQTEGEITRTWTLNEQSRATTDRKNKRSEALAGPRPLAIV